PLITLHHILFKMKFLVISLIYLFVIEIQGYSRCGEELTSVMWEICEKGFNTMIKKRSDHSDTILPAIGNNLPSAYGPGALSQIFQIENGNLLAKTRRLRMYRGIVDECCKKSCTFDELTAYCMS
ncbi:hypothetical protein DOY81_009547, partial [Sarcophaga bullata]